MVIDCHGHVAHPELGERYPIPPNLLDIDGMVEAKTAAGIDCTIVGSPTGAESFAAIPGIDPWAQTVDQLARHHAWLAEIVAKHQGHLAAYAFVNPFGGDAMLDQVARDVRGGGFVGVIITSSVQGRYLSDPGADDFFAWAEELGVPLFLHPPVQPIGGDAMVDQRIAEQVVRFFEVTNGLIAMIFAGRLENHPSLKVLVATAGGGLALVAGRMEAAFRIPSPPFLAKDERLTKPPSELLGNVYVDTANLNVVHTMANIDLLGADHLLLGTDSPPSQMPAQFSLGHVQNLAIEETDRAAILGQNAAQLFGLGA